VPEVQLGLLPGAGGTQRMTKLVSRLFIALPESLVVEVSVRRRRRRFCINLKFFA